MLIFDTIIQIAIALLVVSLPVWIILGVVLFVLAYNQPDLSKKKKLRIWATISIVLPFILLFAILSIWGLVQILGGTALRR